MNTSHNNFLKERENELQKRVKHIANYTLEDFYSHGYSTDEDKKSLSEWVQKEILSTSGIDDMNTYEISLRVLNMLKSLDIVDLEFIHSILFEDITPSEVTISFEVVS